MWLGLQPPSEGKRLEDSLLGKTVVGAVKVGERIVEFAQVDPWCKERAKARHASANLGMIREDHAVDDAGTEMLLASAPPDAFR